MAAGLAAAAVPAAAATATPFVYVTNGGSSTVTAYDTATGTVAATIPVGSDPLFIAVNPAGTTAGVANGNGNTLSVISTATNTVTPTIPVGGGPAGVAVNPAWTTAYVANTGGTVSVVNTATSTVTGTIGGFSTPQRRHRRQRATGHSRRSRDQPCLRSGIRRDQCVDHRQRVHRRHRGRLRLRPASPFTVTSDTPITAAAPAGTGTADVTVTCLPYQRAPDLLPKTGVE